MHTRYLRAALVVIPIPPATPTRDKKQASSKLHSISSFTRFSPPKNPEMVCAYDSIMSCDSCPPVRLVRLRPRFEQGSTGSFITIAYFTHINLRTHALHSIHHSHAIYFITSSGTTHIHILIPPLTTRQP